MVDLADMGLTEAAAVHHNLSTPALFEKVIRRGEGRAAQGGSLVVRTGEYTGRSPGDKFIVDEPSSRGHIWWGEVNRPFDQGDFARLKARVLAHLRDKELFVQ
ncbi:MAG TPA: phosphoenolpyruvate carboxykinase (ATP), partial [Acidimicrobiia bacterium]|nr:phosphoenolpyruvate carboxykinase (ATP) [Acidimicrobiia bacterium]